MLTFAIGDVHGCVDKLIALHVEMQIYARGRPYRTVFLGDYVDRGPNSAGAVDLLSKYQMRHRSEPDRAVFLKGNHEAWLLLAIDHPEIFEEWYPYGKPTLESYGIKHPRDITEPHLQWLRQLRRSFDDGTRFFSHAGMNPAFPLNAQSDLDLLWTKMEADVDVGRFVVHGHIRQESGKPWLGRHRVNIDTGAYKGGPLTAAVFDDSRREPVAFLTHDGTETNVPIMEPAHG